MALSQKITAKAPLLLPQKTVCNINNEKFLQDIRLKLTGKVARLLQDKSKTVAFGSPA